MNLPVIDFQYVTQTHTGMVRERNEDALAVFPECRLMVLADGMGGHNGGDVAAAMAVESVLEQIAAEEQPAGDAEDLAKMLNHAVQIANVAIHERAQTEPGLFGMGTTLIVAAFLADELVCVHVGDSRLYLFRNGALTQLSKDHTVAQEQIDSGMVHPDVARIFGFRGLLSRALGIEPSVDVDIITQSVTAEDRYLLCSDGLTDMLTDDEIARVFSENDGLEETADCLIELANTCGGRDNISLIVARPPVYGREAQE